MSTIPVGRLAGLEIRIHVSWTIILAIIVVSVGAQIGSAEPGSTMAVRWGIGVVVAIVFLVSAMAHELGHASVARRAGRPTDSVVVYFLGAAASPDLDDDPSARRGRDRGGRSDRQRGHRVGAARHLGDRGHGR